MNFDSFGGTIATSTSPHGSTIYTVLDEGASSMVGETSKDRVFLRNVGSALLRLLALALFMGVHHYVDKALILFCPSNLTGEIVFVQDIIFVFFALIYMFLAFDMVRVFVPWLRRAETKIAEPEADK